MTRHRSGLALIALLALCACDRAEPASQEQAKPLAPSERAGGAAPEAPKAAPTPGPETTLVEPSKDLGGALPLKHGYFVADGSTCEDPPNAALRHFDGKGLSGAHTRDCRIEVIAASGKTYEIAQSCLDAGAGPAPRSTERATVVIESNLEFTLKRATNEAHFQFCPASRLPPGLPS
jgi:hypothetical protein